MVISQPAPVFCSQAPSQTTTLASHRQAEHPVAQRQQGGRQRHRRAFDPSGGERSFRAGRLGAGGFHAGTLSANRSRRSTTIRTIPRSCPT